MTAIIWSFSYLSFLGSYIYATNIIYFYSYFFLSLQQTVYSKLVVEISAVLRYVYGCSTLNIHSFCSSNICSKVKFFICYMFSHSFAVKKVAGNPTTSFLLEFLSVSSYLACIAVFYKAPRLVLFLSFQQGFCCLSFYSQKLVAFFPFFFYLIVEKKENSNTCIVRLQSHRRITAANPVASKVPFTKTIFPENFYISFQHVYTQTLFLASGKKDVLFTQFQVGTVKYAVTYNPYRIYFDMKRIHVRYILYCTVEYIKVCSIALPVPLCQNQFAI